VELKKILKKAVFLDPFNSFNPGGRECEIRTDPLTGRNTRILFFPIRVIPELDIEKLKANIEELIKRDPGFCPFCPDNIEKITPKFNPDLFTKERYKVGEAVCFPNVFPYDENGAVTVISKKHLVTSDEFTEDMLKDSFSCCVDYLTDVDSKQPEAIYQSINWNYLPAAGSSIIHPHLQVTASAIPTNYCTDILKTIELSDKNIFTDLVNTEISNEERFIVKEKYFSWMIGFAPEGIFDLIAISHEYFEPKDLKDNRLDELIKNILKSIHFIRSYNILSFNLSLFFILRNERFIPHMRICPRTNVPPLETSEINYMKMLHNEPMTTLKPELVAEQLKNVWNKN